MTKTITALLACGVLIACEAEPTPRETTTAVAAERAPLDVIEGRDGLYARDSAGALRRLTALRVAGFDHDSLAAMQREGQVILYWAAAPVPSPDGRRVAYATNREAVARGTAGQSIWLLDLDARTERPLLAEPGRSFRPVAWFDGDVVHIGDAPGVWSVDVETGATRRLAQGTWIAAARDGSALLVADGVPDDVRLQVITRVERIDVPPPDTRFQWLPAGEFDAGSARIRLEAAADSGRTRRHYDFDVRTRELTRP